MPMLWSQPMMLPRWWGVRICIEVGLEGGCRWMRRLEGGCTRGWRARSPGTSGRMARALNILRVFMVRVWKDECVVLLKQGAFMVLSKRHLLCAKTRSWSFRAAWSGLKVQIVKRKADYWPPHQSLDFTILVSPMQCHPRNFNSHVKSFSCSKLNQTLLKFTESWAQKFGV